MIFTTTDKEICTQEVQVKVYIVLEAKFRSFPIDWEAHWPNFLEPLEAKNLFDHAPVIIQGQSRPLSDIEFQAAFTQLLFLIFLIFFHLLGYLEVPFSLVYGTMDYCNSQSMSGDVPFPLLRAIERDRTREYQIPWPLTHFWSLLNESSCDHLKMKTNIANVSYI